MPSKSVESYYNIANRFEIGVDEVGRGPMFGRLYVAGVILPKDDSFLHKNMKDSKKIHSRKKMAELSDYIKENAISWHIHYIESETIDEINIRQAVLRCMRECIQKIIEQMQDKLDDDFNYEDFMLIIDGNDFKPYTVFNENTASIQEIPHVTIEQGDGKYSCIAAASILAKHARDEYILQLCNDYPLLSSRYKLDNNMGYGTKAHLDGIKEFGITQWHRKSFGICKTSPVNNL
jgi:ribonuclease HII